MRLDHAIKHCREQGVELVIKDGSDLTMFREESKLIYETVRSYFNSKELVLSSSVFTPLATSKENVCSGATVSDTNQISIEKLGMDELFIDISHLVAYIYYKEQSQLSITVPQDSSCHLYGSSDLESSDGCSRSIARCYRIAIDVAYEVRNLIKSQCCYNTSAGIANNKLLAKIASGLHKPNDQSCICSADAALKVVAETSLSKIPNFGHHFTTRCREEFAIQTCGDLRKYFPEPQQFKTVEEQHSNIIAQKIVKVFSDGNSNFLFSNISKFISNTCWGIDKSMVKNYEHIKSISVEDSFPGSTCCFSKHLNLAQLRSMSKDTEDKCSSETSLNTIVNLQQKVLSLCSQLLNRLVSAAQESSLYSHQFRLSLRLQFSNSSQTLPNKKGSRSRLRQSKTANISKSFYEIDARRGLQILYALSLELITSIIEENTVGVANTADSDNFCSINLVNLCAFGLTKQPERRCHIHLKNVLNENNKAINTHKKIRNKTIDFYSKSDDDVDNDDDDDDDDDNESNAEDKNITHNMQYKGKEKVEKCSRSYFDCELKQREVKDVINKSDTTFTQICPVCEEELSSLGTKMFEVHVNSHFTDTNEKSHMAEKKRIIVSETCKGKKSKISSKPAEKMKTAITSYFCKK